MVLKAKTNYLLNRTVSEDATGFNLEKTNSFTLPSKVYGNIDETVSRVLTTFEERDNNLGLLLSGIKGNSKTTTGKVISLKSELPVILVTEPYTGAQFQKFLSGITEKVVIFIDEFEKVYNTPELQEEFLTILDGVFQSKKLFIFTTNSSDINQYLKNRPSRIFYHFKYDNLEKDVIDEIIKNELKNKDFEEELRAVLMVLGNISIDVLLNFIGEINRFNKGPKILVKGLNIEVEQVDFNVRLYANGGMSTFKCDFNPLTRDNFEFYYKTEKDGYRWFHGSFSDYVMYTKDGNFIYENKVNKMIFMPFKPSKFEL